MNSRSEPTRGESISIPCYDTGAAGPLALIDADPGRFQSLMASGLDHYGAPVLKIGDGFTRRWLEKSANPYRHEIGDVAARMGHPGGYLLNLSYEWTCTTGVGPEPDGTGMRMLRTLDWPLPGLGRNVVVGGHEGTSGPWLNITWPGFVGVVTAMAPSRFAAAINQPPMRRLTPSCRADWVINRAAALRSRRLPPVHLLRQVFERAATYGEAKAMLSETPLSIPAFFTLAGPADGEGAVIERSESAVQVREAPASVANHWIAGGRGGRMRGDDSPGRWGMMEEFLDRAVPGFSWVRPPILNPTTRLGVIVNPRKGSLVVQGFEADGPATAVFRL